MYRPRSKITGADLDELFGKMLQSSQSIDIENDLTIHGQCFKLPRSNGCKGVLAVNMGLNILIKICVYKPLDTSNANYIERRFSIYKKR